MKTPGRVSPKSRHDKARWEHQNFFHRTSRSWPLKNLSVYPAALMRISGFEIFIYRVSVPYITILGFDLNFASKTNMVLPFPRDTIETMFEK